MPAPCGRGMLERVLWLDRHGPTSGKARSGSVPLPVSSLVAQNRRVSAFHDPFPLRRQPCDLIYGNEGVKRLPLPAAAWRESSVAKTPEASLNERHGRSSSPAQAKERSGSRRDRSHSRSGSRGALNRSHSHSGSTILGTSRSVASSVATALPSSPERPGSRSQLAASHSLPSLEKAFAKASCSPQSYGPYVSAVHLRSPDMDGVNVGCCNAWAHTLRVDAWP
eukprot:TRINITY_DN91314_c0_g1_i1.p1 TRINITY_DN91314_c0_g1~~TRINITY_DN91314_c0_g1_i1.p1  ORF type:complete len:223 (-),score=24.04 TRINITY_DN91314_c0_g1_i1:227-895(-)